MAGRVSGHTGDVRGAGGVLGGRWGDRVGDVIDTRWPDGAEPLRLVE